MDKSENELELRKHALNEAARHRLGTEKAADVVENAKNYFEFLQGEDK